VGRNPDPERTRGCANAGPWDGPTSKGQGPGLSAADTIAAFRSQSVRNSLLIVGNLCDTITDALVKKALKVCILFSNFFWFTFGLLSAIDFKIAFDSCLMLIMRFISGQQALLSQLLIQLA
jgi:hypothetical protein